MLTPHQSISVRCLKKRRALGAFIISNCEPANRLRSAMRASNDRPKLCIFALAPYR